MAHLTHDIISTLQHTIDSYIAKENGIPGLVCHIVNRDGEVIFKSASGKRGVGLDTPMTQDTVFWIASCTKLITAIAAMQLVEKNHLTLDDGDAVERFLPELASVKVLEEVPGRGVALVDKVRKITLRMLLSHTGKYSPRINWPPDG
jgi:CubicO group peptidase (beta-lactamase class C family)